MRGCGLNLREGDEFIAMGHLVSLVYEDGPDVVRVEFPPPRPFLAEQHRTGDLFIVRGGRAKRARAGAVSRKRYEQINWGERDPRVTVRNLPRVSFGESYAELGPLLEVTYESDKSGEVTHWVHAFEKPLPLLVEHEPSGGLFLLGGGYRVTSRGIVR